MNNLEKVQMQIKSAIEAKCKIKITYQSFKDAQPKERVVQPFVLGKLTTDNIVLLGEQELGGSGMGMRQYLVERIEDVDLLPDETFEKPIEDLKESAWNLVIAAVK